MVCVPPNIASIWPEAVIPGGLIEIHGEALANHSYTPPRVWIGGTRARPAFFGRRQIVVQVPEAASTGHVTVQTTGGRSDRARFALGELLADKVHPVANPAIDSNGNVFTTFSGPRGKESDVSLFKIRASDGEVIPFLSGIVNPTGLAMLADDTLLVSSRHDGTVYAVSPNAEIEVFAEGMGVATGLAVDKDQNVYVGDRSGTVFKIDKSKRIFVYATLEPSVAAFHPAFCESDQNLYVCAPSTSSCETIQRIDSNGQVQRHWQCFGRPQGIAFDSKDRIYVCASRDGRRGITRLKGISSGEGAEVLEHVVSGQGIVGIAVAPDDSLVVATGSGIYRLPPIP